MIIFWIIIREAILCFEFKRIDTFVTYFSFSFSKMKILNYLLKIRFIEFNLILLTFSKQFSKQFSNINARLFVKNINNSVINRRADVIRGVLKYFFFLFFFLSESCTINYKTVCWFHATVQLYCYTIARIWSLAFEDDTRVSR